MKKITFTRIHPIIAENFYSVQTDPFIYKGSIEKGLKILKQAGISDPQLLMAHVEFSDGLILDVELGIDIPNDPVLRELNIEFAITHPSYYPNSYPSTLPSAFLTTHFGDLLKEILDVLGYKKNFNTFVLDERSAFYIPIIRSRINQLNRHERYDELKELFEKNGLEIIFNENGDFKIPISEGYEIKGEIIQHKPAEYPIVNISAITPKKTFRLYDLDFSIESLPYRIPMFCSIKDTLIKIRDMGETL